MTPFVGPTGYVLPFSQIAETVREEGVERTNEKFHAKVMDRDGAILKKAMVVSGGWVMVSRPAGAVWGMVSLEVELEVELAVALVALLDVAADEDIFSRLLCWRR